MVRGTLAKVPYPGSFNGLALLIFVEVACLWKWVCFLNDWYVLSESRAGKTCLEAGVDLLMCMVFDRLSCLE